MADPGSANPDMARTMRPRFLFILAAILALAVAAWTGAWFWFAGEIRDGLGRFVVQQERAGAEFDWGPVEISGYPTGFDIYLPDASVEWIHGERLMVLAGPGLHASVAPFALDRANYASPGRHVLQVEQGTRKLRYEMTFAALFGDVVLNDSGDLNRVTAQFDDARVAAEHLDGPLTVDRGSMELIRDEAEATPDAIHPEGTSRRIVTEMANLRLPLGLVDEGARGALGDTISRFALDASLRGALDPTAADRERLAAWRDAGGTLEINDLTIVWGPLAIAGDGTLALDDNMQPEGAFTAKITGMADLVDALQQAGSISPRDAAVARISLAVLTRAQEGGAPPAAEVPVSIQDRVVSLGPVPLVQLPEITWR